MRNLILYTTASIPRKRRCCTRTGSVGFMHHVTLRADDHVITEL